MALPVSTGKSHCMICKSVVHEVAPPLRTVSSQWMAKPLHADKD